MFVALLVATVALAQDDPWTHEGWVWRAEDNPIRYCIAEIPTFPHMTEQEVRKSVKAALRSWEQASPHLSFQEVTDCKDPNTVSEPMIRISFGDSGDVDGPDLHPGEDGCRPLAAYFLRVGSIDLMVGDSGMGPSCDGKFHLPSFLSHELGHAIGLGDACGFYEDCGGVMAPGLVECSQLWVGQGDRDGVEALYGPESLCDVARDTGEPLVEDQTTATSPESSCACSTGSDPGLWTLAFFGLLVGFRRRTP